jgi:hypothetical protein
MLETSDVGERETAAELGHVQYMNIWAKSQVELKN